MCAIAAGTTVPTFIGQISFRNTNVSSTFYFPSHPRRKLKIFKSTQVIFNTLNFKIKFSLNFNRLFSNTLKLFRIPESSENFSAARRTPDFFFLSVYFFFFYNITFLCLFGIQISRVSSS